MAHTPGEFSYRKSGKPDNTGGYDFAIVDADGEIIAETFEHVGYPKTPESSFDTRPAEDNAKLFCAAPDLLAALKLILEVYALIPEEHWPDGVREGVAAVAKAEGRA